MPGHLVPGHLVPGHSVPGHSVPGYSVPGYAVQCSLRRRWSLLGCSLLAVSCLLLSPLAWADTTSCSSAHESAQLAQQEGRLQDASILLTTCASDAACPDLIRNDCSAIYKSIVDALPTVIFVVLDGKRELSGARVFADGLLIADSLDGRALALDPGRHRLKVELPDGRTQGSEVVLHEGVKNRLIRVQIAPKVSSGTAQPAQNLGPSRTAFWLASAAAAGALTTGAVFSVLGYSKERAVANEIRDCSPSLPCSRQLYADGKQQLEDARGAYTAGNIAFALGGVAAATAAVLYWTTSERDDEPSPNAVRRERIAVTPASKGLGAAVHLQF